MTNNYHTPIPIGAAADAFTFRTPLGELDQAITNLYTTVAGLTFNGLAPTTTKGDLIVHNGAGNVRLPVGANGQALVADSAQAAGLKWGTGGTQEEFPHVTGGNSAAETTIVSKLIPANSMGTKGLIRLHASVLITNNTGATQDVTYRWKFGGTTIASRLLSSSTVYTAIRMSLALREGNGTARQLAEAYLRRVSLTSLGTVGAASHEMTMNILTVNHALDQTVQFSLQFTNAVSTLTWELVDAVLEGPFESS